MAKVAEVGNLETKRHNLFVPARGGIGESVNVQANSVSSVMAMQTNGDYRSLFVPEQLSMNTYEFLLKEPAIVDVLNLISQANCVIHSIGRRCIWRLDENVRTRNSDVKTKMQLQNPLGISLTKLARSSTKFLASDFN